MMASAAATRSAPGCKVGAVANRRDQPVDRTAAGGRA